MQIPVTIGDQEFPSKVAARKRCQEILRQYPIGTRVTSTVDERFLRALSKRHPDTVAKLGTLEVDHFAIGQAGPHKNFLTPCFLFVTKEGTSVHFSFEKCLK